MFFKGCGGSTFTWPFEIRLEINRQDYLIGKGNSFVGTNESLIGPMNIDIDIKIIAV